MKRTASTGLAAALTLAGAVSGAAAEGPGHFERPAALVRDRDFNRTMRRSPVARVTSAASQGNLVSVTQEGRGNTVILNLRQTNTGAISAGAALNGTLDLD